MTKKIRNLTIEELVYYCGKNLNNECEKCHFNHQGRCLRLIDFGIINLDDEIEINKHNSTKQEILKKALEVE